VSRKGKPDVDALKNDPSYRQVLALDYDDMIPFVLENIRKRSFFSILYAFLNIAFLIFIINDIIFGLVHRQLTWSLIISQSVTGIFAGSILVIPVHELLHGITYRILGARKIRFGADLQQFIFFVTADRYPVTGKELYCLALAPFVVINIITAAITLLWFPHAILFSAFFLLSHNIMCIGDFAIVNFVLQHAPHRVYTFDEIENKKSYFYEEITLP
jgi:hypothetical protein